MITDDDLFDLFIKADPAALPDIGAPSVESAWRSLRERLDAEPVVEWTLVPGGESERRAFTRWTTALTIAAATAMLAAAFVLARGGPPAPAIEPGTTAPTIPPTTTPSVITPIDGRDPTQEIVERFAAGLGRLDVETVVPMLAPDADLGALLSEPAPAGVVDNSVDELRLDFTAMRAMGYRQIDEGCQLLYSRTRIWRCHYAFHMLGSEQLGLGPFSGNTLYVTMRDGEVVDVVRTSEHETFRSLLLDSFAAWIDEVHPEETAILFRDHDISNLDGDPEWLARWQRRIDEFVGAGRRVGFIGVAAGPPTLLQPNATLAHRVSWCGGQQETAAQGRCEGELALYDDGTLVWRADRDIAEGANPARSGWLVQRLTAAGVQAVRREITVDTPLDDAVARLRHPNSWPDGTWSDATIDAYVASSYSICVMGPSVSDAELMAQLPADASATASQWEWVDRSGRPRARCATGVATDQARQFAEALDRADAVRDPYDNAYELAFNISAGTRSAWLLLTVAPDLP